MAITTRKVELFWGFELQKKKVFFYHTTLMSTPSLHMTYMTRNDGADRARCVCVCVRSARKRFCPWAERAPGSSSRPCDLSVPSLSCLSIPSLSVSSSLLSARIPSSPHLALSLSSAQGDAVLQALIRGPGRREEVGQKVVLETAGEQGWNIE